MKIPFITVVGSVNMDLVFQTPHMPVPGETVEGQTFRTIAGGKGANQAVAIARHGVPTTLIGCTGDDDFAKQLRMTLENDHIDLTHLYTQVEIATGVAGIFVNQQGENSIVVAPGANHHLQPSHIELAHDKIRQASLLVCQLETPLASVTYAIKLAKQNKVPVIFNPAPMQTLSDELLKQIDYLIINQTEAQQLTGIEVHNLETAQQAAKILENRGTRTIIITLGAQGAFIRSHTLTSSYEETFIPAIKVNAIDTTAAGDTFVGAFAVGLLREMTLHDACAHAQYAAALTVTKIGAQTAIPYHEEIEQFKKVSVIG